LEYKAELVYANGNQAEQNTQIRGLIAKGAQLLIVGNVTTEIVPVITEAKNKGITVIAYDRLIQGTGDYDYYITFNNYKVGQMQGQSIIDSLNLNSSKNIALFAGGSNDKNAEFFFKGAMEILNPNIASGKLKVIGSSSWPEVCIAYWWPEGDHARMDTIFGSNNTIDAVLAPNDEIARYIIDNYSFSGVITGQDAEFKSAMYIKEGKQTMTVFKNTRVLAASAVQLADQLLGGKEINVSGTILAKGDLAEMGDTGVKRVTTFIADPKVINKNNLQEELVDTDWFTPDEKAQLR
jgi:putative multiple sugar transport system substrate-binding protein